ncbi:MAG: SufD family Fe-S cluster assembly protein [Aeriscardovia sp.]|nr:SufD family Fe-S cluster assembly protein [Aeriscardovia sp.]
MRADDGLFEPEGRASFNPADFGGLEKKEEWKYAHLEEVCGFAEAFEPSNSSRVLLNGSDAPEGEAEKLLTPRDRVEAAGFSSVGRAFPIRMPEGKSEIKVVNEGPRDAVFLSLDFGEGGKSDALLSFEGAGEGVYFLDVKAGEGSEASLTVLCRGGGKKFVYDSTRIARDAKAKRNLVCLGGEFVRYSSGAYFAGPGGEAEMNGVYFSSGKNYIECRVRVAHAVPGCKSRVSYRGALLGAEARSAWVGESIIGKGGQGSDSYELNKNFVLTPGAKSFSEPQLEIKNGDILSAGHSSSVGYFDPDQLFYLRSRGIGEEEAKKMIISGFFDELLLQMGSEEAEREFKDFCRKAGVRDGAQA